MNLAYPARVMTHTGGDVYRFGPFELDSAQRRLLRSGEPIGLPERHLDVLVYLVSHAGRVVGKEVLAKDVWHGAAITDNTLERAIWNLRRTLGTQPDGTQYIDTLVRLGYRFVAPVERRPPSLLRPSLDTQLAPGQAFVDGREDLESFDREAVARARWVYEDALQTVPNHPSAHLGLANACMLAHDATRADIDPDVTSLQKAEHHAREACRLDPRPGEAWSTLACVLHRKGDRRAAIAAARTAVSLEPDVWRHHLRFASVSWGDERLVATRRALELCPDLALAHWLRASVFVARQAFDTALEELRAGCAAQDAQRKGTARFHGVGLHLLHGLVLAARGAVEEAQREFEQELAMLDDGQVYARECAANTWYARGALHLRLGCFGEADVAFRRALTLVPGHPFASVGAAALATHSLAAVSGREGLQQVDMAIKAPVPTSRGTAVDAAIVTAATLALVGRHDEAARLCGHALEAAEPGAAGWQVPIEPLLHVTAHRAVWTETLTTLRHRAV